MNKQNQISLCKSLLRHHFRPSPKPRPPFPSNSLAPTLTRTGPGTVEPQPAGFLHTPASKFHTFGHPMRQNGQTRSATLQTRRGIGGDSVCSEVDVTKEVDMINLKFAEAREEIEMAMDSKETVYFNEEAECAREAVKEVLDMFDGLLSKVSDSEKAALVRSMGLKIEQLKAELKQLDD